MTKSIHIKKYIVSVLLLFILSNVVYAQELYFKNLNIESGLSQEDVSSIVQDSYGFIWIGTYDGLNRFDGRNIETFHIESVNAASLPDNRINALVEDHKKRLWIGTQAGLFCYYSLLTERFIRVKSPENTGEILSFVQSKNNTLYAMTSRGILRFMETPEPKFEFVANSQNYHFRDAIQKPNGDMVFVGNTGIFRLVGEELIEVPNPDKELFTSIAIADTLLIAGSGTGIYSINNINGADKLQKIHLPDTKITDIINDQLGNLWVGTENDGLFQFDKSLNLLKHLMASKTKSRGLLSNNIQELYHDQYNNLWVGSRQGICYTSLNNVGFNSIELDDTHKPNIRSILINGNDLVLGIQNEGLFQYDILTTALKKINVAKINYVNQIEEIDSLIYVCSDRGLLALTNDYSLESIYRIPDYPSNEPSNIRCIAKDDFERIFIGTANGFLLKKNEEINWIWNSYPSLQKLSQYYIFRMFYDPIANQLLIGTRSKGLLILDMGKDGQISTEVKEGLLNIKGNLISNTSVWVFYQARNNTIWLGTDLGLFKREPNDKLFQQIGVEGILDKKIMSIAEDANNNLWLSNTHGLIHFNPITNKVKTYTYEDGLLSSSMTEASAYYGDQIFFGTTNGLNYINPLKITSNPFHPKVLLANLTINNVLVKPEVKLFGSVILNENINATKQLHLNHLQNNFSLDFSATNFSKNFQNNFRYRLEGYDSRWIYTSSNTVISYSNLDPGSYKLEIQVEDNNGNWPNNGYNLLINMSPAPWKTPVAYAIYIIIISTVIIAFVFFWFQRQRLNHQIELDQIKINQDEELREKQLRFFVDVGHEFKTPLSLILAPFNDLTNENLSKEQKSMCLQIVSRNISRMNFLVHQLLDLGRISEGQKFIKVTRNDLRMAVREYTKAFEWQIQYENIDLRLNLDKCEGYFDHVVLEKGFYNVLSNAVKYTPRGGVIDITLKEKQIEGKNNAVITVSDSGPGIPDDQKSHVFERFYHGKDRASSGIGLHLAHSLIQAHSGTISVEDSELGGAKFKITLPISLISYSEGENEANIEAINQGAAHETSNSFDDDVLEKEETILIVEDDYELRNYLNISLQNEYSILEANNGEQGLMMTKENLPDIIISDIMMPIMDGIEMCQQLKSNKDTSHIPILFLTAKRDEEVQKKALMVGAWDYITKPFDSEALRRKVINILETRNRFKKYLLNHNINFDIKSHYTSYDQKLLENINQVIESNLNNPNFTASDLASEVGLSRMHLHRKLKTLAGETAKSIITRVKIKYAVNMFDNGCDRVQEAMNDVGMTNYGNFNNNFKKIMNVTATEYIAGLKENGNV